MTTNHTPVPRTSSRPRKGGWESQWVGLLFVLPFMIGLTVLFIGPILAVPIMSLYNWVLPRAPEWIGLGNYARMGTDREVLHSVWVTVLFVVMLVPTNIILALGLALLLNVKAKALGFFRMALFSPVVVPLVAWALVWRFVLQPDFGLVNVLLGKLGIQGPNWLFEAPWALIAVVVCLVIEHVGMNMLIFLGALQNVPAEVHEAAKIDGANSSQTFFKVTLPLMSPTVFLTVIVTLIGALKSFAPIYVLTGGSDATSVLMVQMWKQGFKYFDFGYASGLSWLIFLVMLTLTWMQWQLRKRWVFYES
ncbi:carbohydrate ABC transporter permease [Deinococcus roseus]|uniref:Sugar ABC transporter permease n=1 Tax=Deinococcus roseus TaxID=392414 RepID=A0ABQ2DGS7_9DEIO|nr:sugar ABC transporter permease [Deinococcus roseus]GGJ57203.1 sugar ABC transporter permease [Deinococcus roseus]